MDRPLPKPTAETQPFWEGCARGELLFQYCGRCDRGQFPPSNRCRTCHEDSLEWRQSDKHGIIHSVTTVFRAPNAAFKKAAPYKIALVDLTEGFRIMTNITNAGEADAVIGAPVRIVFEDVGDIALPQAELDNRTNPS
ncbi:MAG: Zn-ribbon domain-containing OB-fold protein [Gammaproteobacteria bacterium]|nr:Zn-ribbon domain-containing OB-fold protein [Gammaproteobacteria bacterium]